MNPYQFIADRKEINCTAAQRTLQRALIELNQKKEIYCISVKELCNQAHVARSTFYSYYDNIPLFFVHNRGLCRSLITSALL